MDLKHSFFLALFHTLNLSRPLLAHVAQAAVGFNTPYCIYPTLSSGNSPFWLQCHPPSREALTSIATTPTVSSVIYTSTPYSGSSFISCFLGAHSQSPPLLSYSAQTSHMVPLRFTTLQMAFWLAFWSAYHGYSPTVSCRRSITMKKAAKKPWLELYFSRHVASQ